MTVLDSRFQVLDCGFLVSGTWIPDHSRKLNCRFQSPAFPGSTNKGFPDCGLGKQKFPGFWNPDYITYAKGGTRHRNAGFALATKSLRTVISSPRLRNKVRHSTAKIRQSMGIDQIKLSYI